MVLFKNNPLQFTVIVYCAVTDVHDIVYEEMMRLAWKVFCLGYMSTGDEESHFHVVSLETFCERLSALNTIEALLIRQ